MVNTTYTIYWKHPYHGEGSFTLCRRTTPHEVAEEAADMLAWDLIDDHEDELEMALLLDDLEVDVYEGVCLVRPTSRPLASFI